MIRLSTVSIIYTTDVSFSVYVEHTLKQTKFYLVHVTAIVSRETDTGVAVVVKEIRCFYFHIIDQNIRGAENKSI